MKTYKRLYEEIISEDNLSEAFKKARKGKLKKNYIKNFIKDLKNNLSNLQVELFLHTYEPKTLETFIIRDPKTRKISKSDFRDRIVHHAVYNILNPIFEKSFIFDSYANRMGKGPLKALQRFDNFKRKVSKNKNTNSWFNSQGRVYVLKADIKHYFETVDHQILLSIIGRKIKCKKTIWLITKILKNYGGGRPKNWNATWKFNLSILCQYLSK